MISKREVVHATLGGSIALTALVVLFFGLLLAILRSSPPGAHRYRVVARIVGAAFACGVLSVALSAWWVLTVHQDSRARKIAIGALVLEFVLVVGSMIATLVLYAASKPGPGLLSTPLEERVKGIQANIPAWEPPTG